MSIIHTYSITLDGMHEIAHAILQHHPHIITLSGELGAGKTTLTQHILSQLGIQEPVASPTYAYVTSYITPSGLFIYHFDLYRLTSLQDFRQAGFEEYLYQPNTLCIIEWPTHVMPLLTQTACHTTLTYDGTTSRRITVQYV